MLKGREITVAGAGIGGLAAALALARRGARVRVLERAERIAEVGAGLQIGPNGVAVLDALGLGQVARARAVTARAIGLFDGPSGRPVARLDLGGGAGRTGRAAGSYLLFHRADLQDLLLEAARARGVVIETGCQVRALRSRSGHVRLELAGGGCREADFAIGADGLRSVFRAALNPPETPFFTGQVAWRALVAGDGRAAPEARLFLGPGRHLVSYPLRGGKLVNLVAVEERREWAEEGWFNRDDPARLRAAFAGFAAPVAGLLERVEEVFLWGLFRHRVALEWHRGRVAILGDAAHPTLPFMAQGAVMALEDAWVLADSLAGLGLEDGPALYQARRRGRVERVIAAANRNARNYHLRNPLLRALAHGGLRLADRLAPGRLLARYDWIYGHDVTRQ